MQTDQPQNGPSLEKLGRAAVSEYLLEAGEQITGARMEGQSLLVSTGDSTWRFHRVEKGRYFAPQMYQLFEARPNVRVEPPAPAQGFATVGNRLFHLNSETEFGAFLNALDTVPQGVELAELLTLYHGEGRPQVVVRNSDDVLHLLNEEQLDELNEFTALTQSETASGKRLLDFCSYYLEPKPPQGVYHVGMVRWRVEINEEARLSWSKRTIAEGLESHKYSG